jgi:hypothetical protein
MVLGLVVALVMEKTGIDISPIVGVFSGMGATSLHGFAKGVQESVMGK